MIGRSFGVVLGGGPASLRCTRRRSGAAFCSLVCVRARSGRLRVANEWVLTMLWVVFQGCSCRVGVRGVFQSCSERFVCGVGLFGGGAVRWRGWSRESPPQPEASTTCPCIRTFGLGTRHKRRRRECKSTRSTEPVRAGVAWAQGVGGGSEACRRIQGAAVQTSDRTVPARCAERRAARLRGPQWRGRRAAGQMRRRDGGNSTPPSRAPRKRASALSARGSRVTPPAAQRVLRQTDQPGAWYSVTEGALAVRKATAAQPAERAERRGHLPVPGGAVGPRLAWGAPGGGGAWGRGRRDP